MAAGAGWRSRYRPGLERDAWRAAVPDPRRRWPARPAGGAAAAPLPDLPPATPTRTTRKTLRSDPVAQARLWPPAGERTRIWPASRPSPASRIAFPPGTATGWPRRWARSTCGSGNGTASPPTSCWTSTAPMTRRMGSRRAGPITATTSSTCITPCWSSMARRGTSSPPCCDPAPSMPDTEHSGHPAAHRGAAARAVARGRHHHPRRCGLCQARAFRVVRGRGHRLHHRAGHQPPPAGAGGSRSRRPRRRPPTRREARKVRLVGETPYQAGIVGGSRAGWSSRRRSWPRDPTSASW